MLFAAQWVEQDTSRQEVLMSLIRPNAGWPAAAPQMKSGEWFVLRTRSRHEKILARELNGVGITAYLLTILETRQYDRQPVNVEVPLFKRVVFVYGSLDDISIAMKTGRVVSVARAMDQVGLQADFELLAATLPTEPHSPPPPAKATILELHRDVIGRLRRAAEHSTDAPRLR